MRIPKWLRRLPVDEPIPYVPTAQAQARDPHIAAMLQRSRELALELLPSSDSPLYDDVVASARARDGLAAEVEQWLASQTAGGAR